jgi:hypothetical protein
MRLAELNPEFRRGDGAKGYLSFDCPGCVACATWGGPKIANQPYRHRIQGLPTFDGEATNTGINRWGLTGNPPDWDSVSLTPSIAMNGECRWHGFITNGEAA